MLHLEVSYLMNNWMVIFIEVISEFHLENPLQFALKVCLT